MSTFVITIDGREPSIVFETFKNRNTKHAKSNLDVGDFEISTEDRVAMLIERKTWGDLESSLKDGRLNEQTARIVDKCRTTGARPILLIEHASVLGWDENKAIKFFDCTLVKYALEGFSVVRTRNVEHTHDVVKWLFERCEKGKIPAFLPEFSFRGEAGKKQFRKKDYGCPWETLLTAVRGISKTKAKAIKSEYPNARVLITGLDSGTVKVKGIGKKLVGELQKAFLA